MTSYIKIVYDHSTQITRYVHRTFAKEKLLSTTQLCSKLQRMSVYIDVSRSEQKECFPRHSVVKTRDDQPTHRSRKGRDHVIKRENFIVHQQSIVHHSQLRYHYVGRVTITSGSPNFRHVVIALMKERQCRKVSRSRKRIK